MNKVVLLVNLGSPEQLSVKSIRVFLRDFLSDKRVVGLPKFIWYPILYGIILPFRAKKLIHKYQQIWLENGESPLCYYTKKQTELLSQLFDGLTTRAAYAYSYGAQDIKQVLHDLHATSQIDQLIVIPLYPQYSSSTTASVFDQIGSYYQQKYYIPEIKFINSFAANSSYIELLANKVKNHWSQVGKADKLVVSFHSIPQKLVDNGDTYQKDCELTYKLLCAALNLNNNEAVLCYQSKFGRAKWIEPSTESTIKQLAKSSCMTIDVICPGFVSDCLETLEEIKVDYAGLFKRNGGNELRYIACFNDDVQFSNLLKELVGE
jgi:ferrochelatase